MKLGQHFLHNIFFISKFISYVNLDIKPIIEIGCGKGNITAYLNPDLCIEYDEKFTKYLKNFNLILGDARYLPAIRGQIVSSLPYYITKDFLKEIGKLNEIRRAVLILQKDVVDKLLEEPTYISFLINFVFKLQAKDTIPPNAFNPRPKVFSQIIIMDRIRQYASDIDEILRCISNFKKKTLSHICRLCNLKCKDDINKRLEEFKPCRVIELLHLLGINYV
ncbi:MAG: 16S ribosomal RNA methyltransferase A [Sulfolobus sp.]|nr:16S ribosomal RNA methyltransferase A [Sulfolobus sp.]